MRGDAARRGLTGSGVAGPGTVVRRSDRVTGAGRYATAWRRRVGGAVAAVAVMATGACSRPRGAAVAPASSSSPTTPAPQATVPPPTVGSAPAAPAAEVWVALESGALVRVDIGAGRATARVATGGAAHNATAVPGGGAAATVAGRGAVAFSSGPAAVTGGRPHDVKQAGGGRLVVTDGGGRRLVLVGADRAVEATVDLPGVPHDVAVTGDGAQAWVSLDNRDVVVVVDLVARRVARTIATGRRPHDLLFSPSGELWVTDLGGTLYPMEAGATAGPELPLGQEAHHLAFSPDGAELWVTDSPGRAVTVVDPRRRAVLDRVALPGSPHHLVVLGGQVALADNTRGRLVVLDRATRRIVEEIEVGAAPHGVAAAMA